MTLTLPCPQVTANESDASTDLPSTAADLRSATAINAAITQVHEDGWDSPSGRALLDALAVTCQRLAVRVEAGAHVAHDSSRANDLLSHAWELINSNPYAVLSAENPWAYLTTCLRRTLTNTLMADSLLVSPIMVRNGTASRAGLRPPIRAGDRWRDLDSGADGETPARRPNNRNWDVGLQRLHEHLVRLGAPTTTTATAIDRITEIIIEVRRGRRESAVGSDPELAELGLTPAQSRALLALLIGARHDRGRSSLWLSLRSDGDMLSDRHAERCADRRARTYLQPFGATTDTAA